MGYNDIEKQRAYQREWIKKKKQDSAKKAAVWEVRLKWVRANREYIRKQNNLWQKENLEKRRASRRKYRLTHPEKTREWRRVGYYRHREKWLAYNKARFQKKKELVRKFIEDEGLSFFVALNPRAITLKSYVENLHRRGTQAQSPPEIRQRPCLQFPRDEELREECLHGVSCKERLVQAFRKFHQSKFGVLHCKTEGDKTSLPQREARLRQLRESGLRRSKRAGVARRWADSGVSDQERIPGEARD